MGYWRGERASIHLEDAEVLAHAAFAGEQYVLSLRAPETARRALAGQFVHLTCGPGLPMRRPLSLMRVQPESGSIELLYKVLGEGTALLAGRRPGERLSLLGPIGRPFRQEGYRRLPLLIGGGVGIPPMIFLAEHLRRTARHVNPLVLMGSEIPFPFTPRPSTRLVPELPGEAIAAMPLLEDWGIASRLASRQGFPGCFDGFVTDLARLWLGALAPAARAEVEIYACGPTPMLQAVQALAAEFDLPAELSLEEHMACAVGGCAGCTVLIEEEGRRAMRRVCVDGPVFAAQTVVFQG
ncbi:MAG TPA: dihydroorotate dehydrogenase electron transfer subunit [Gammaproteobacteria bacterium]|nr:dihydroorotate dehydrogenase electron transfer subunit [Gammaproteobacteria bacterium]